MGDIARTPCCHHIEVKQRSSRAIQGRAIFERFQPEVECEHKDENRNSLVIVRASDRSRNVAWCDANEESCPESGTFPALAFLVLTELSTKQVRRAAKSGSAAS